MLGIMLRHGMEYKARKALLELFHKRTVFQLSVEQKRRIELLWTVLRFVEPTLGENRIVSPDPKVLWGPDPKELQLRCP